MHQISEMADAALNRISRTIGRATAQIKEAEKEFNEAWEEAFETFDEFGLEGKEARFIADDGYYIARQVQQRPTKLDDDLIQLAIFRHYGKTKGKAIWESITVRKVDPAALQKALLTGEIEPSAVENLLPEMKSTPRRVRDEWTKADAEKAIIFGIEKKEE